LKQIKFEISVRTILLIWNNIMKKIVTAVSLALVSANVAALPLIDFWAGGYAWQTQYNGFVAANPNSLDLQDDLNLEDSTNNVIWAAFEHPVPLIPNVQLKQTTLETNGQANFDQNYNFGGQDTGQNSLDISANLNHTDLTLYYGLPLPIATVDFGLNVRQFDSEFIIGSADNSFDGPVPMLFARVGAELPFTGLAVMAEANYVGYGDTDHKDYQLVVRYTLPFLPLLDINVEAGYRAFELNLDPTDFGGDSDDLTVDIDMSGAFFGISLHL
jgi:outer membrane protein